MDASKGGRSNPYWAPKIWHGMTLGDWLTVLARNRFAVAPRWIPAALGVTATSVVHSVLSVAQRLVYGARLAATPLPQSPVFILGHWRSGTTLLQQLLAVDPRLTFPTSFECFAPRSCLIARRAFGRWLERLHPQQRSVDAMATGLDHPHEDEYALCNMGSGSPYERVGFPRQRQHEEWLDLAEVSASDRRLWGRALIEFTRLVSLRSGGKRIVLKSPPHTARIALLLELFPEARFIHIVRDPRSVIPSTVWLWSQLERVHGLQEPLDEGREQRVLAEFDRMYRAYFDQAPLIPDGHLLEVRYEELIANPLGAVESIYRSLMLGDFEAVRGSLQKDWAGRKQYQTNKYDVEPRLLAEIERHCGAFMRRYGYEQSADQRKCA